MLELFYAELNKLGSQLWLRHAVCYILLISAGLHMIKLEPKAHYFIVEMGARFYELYVQVLRCLPRGGLSKLNLLLYDVLFLFFKLVDKVIG